MKLTSNQEKPKSEFKPKKRLSKFGKNYLVKESGLQVAPESFTFSQAKGQHYGHYTWERGFAVFPIPLSVWEKLWG